jgi:diguanylate cyclase (GGDEF)-like protein
MNILLQSTEGDIAKSNECPELAAQVRQRKGAEKLKAISQVCIFNHELRLVTIVPLGGLIVEGYLSVVVNPLVALSHAEEGLGIPLLIKASDESLLYRSKNWPAQDQMQNVLMVDYGFRAGNKKPVAKFLFASDVTLLRQNLYETRLLIIAAVVIVTLIAMAIALGLFRRTIILPLSQITERLNLIQKDKTYLKENIVIKGSAELENLATDLNLMSSELHRLYYELEVMAFTDSLTGIPNRALLFDRLQQMTQFAKRDASSGEFMLMMMDLNRFKAVNDELGHNIGDQLLKKVAQRLKKALRSADTVARLGGDEFAIILYSVSDKAIAESVAKKITHLMNQLFEIDDYQLDVGMSIGVARFPYDGDDSSHLMHCADMAMYYAKQNNLPYAFYSDEIRQQRRPLNAANEDQQV